MGVGVVSWMTLPARLLSDAEVGIAPQQSQSAGSVTFDDLISKDRSAERIEHIKTGGEVALIPPAIVLVVGAVLGWALGGFRAA
jgi:hypothetical protein